MYYSLLFLLVCFNCCSTDVTKLDCVSQPEPLCEPKYKYRTVDGSCNNLKHIEWGQAFRCYSRFREANYPDYYGQNIRNENLKNPRDLGNALFEESSCPKTVQKSTYMVMMFGQFLANEMTYTATELTNLFLMTENPCCNRSVSKLHPKCAPIHIQEDDVYARKYNFNCINFIRSDACTTCDQSTRVPINMRTPFIDFGTFYGNSYSENKVQRTFKNGLLKSEKTGFLPDAGINEEGYCGYVHRTYYPDEKNISCFDGGDSYLNNNGPKVSLITVFEREHNRLARIINKRQPELDDEEIYQTARRYSIAKLQAIVYKEFLFSFFGEKEMNARKLSILNNGYTDYDQEVDPRTNVEFSSAAFRVIGHSMMPDDILHILKNGTKVVTKLKDSFQYMKDFYSKFPAYLRGAMSLTVDPVDICFSDVVRQNHEKIHRDPRNHGNDLAAIDVQRGRDHGLPSYTQIVKECFNRKVSRFENLASFITMENIEKLKSQYKSVDDIDLYVGIAAETIQNGTMLGKVAMCLWSDHFYRVKFGDRFYFEHGNQIGSFSKAELQYLRKSSLSHLLCLNVDEFKNENVPRNAFQTISDSNKVVSCQTLISETLSFEEKLFGK